MGSVSIGLIHHPVVNKYNEVVTSSVTTIDVHDIARLCRTYGAATLYVVTPLKPQQRLVERVMKHWTQGFGGEYNPDRKEALTLVKVVDTIDDMMDNLSLDSDRVTVAVTSARDADSSVSFAEGRASLEQAEKSVILFGTAHGLDASVVEKADIRIEPVKGIDNYNHLPVRCAAAIIMDRLLGRGDLEKKR